MAEHANEYLTPNTRASQGRIADNLWPVLDRRRECSTAHRGMPRTALANGACERRLRTALANGACERRKRRSAFQHASALRPQLISISARRLRRLVSQGLSHEQAETPTSARQGAC